MRKVSDNLTILRAVRGGTWAHQSGRPASGRTVGAAGLGIVADDLWICDHEENFGMGPDEIRPIRRANPPDIGWAWQQDQTCLPVAGEHRMVRALAPDWARWKGQIDLPPLGPGEDHPGNARYAAAVAAKKAAEVAEAQREADRKNTSRAALSGPITPSKDWLAANGADSDAVAHIVECDAVVRGLSDDEKEVWAEVLAGRLPYGEVAGYLPAPTSHLHEAVHATMIRVARDRAVGLWINAPCLDLAAKRDGWDRMAAKTLRCRLMSDVAEVERNVAFWRGATVSVTTIQREVCVGSPGGRTRDEFGDWEVGPGDSFFYAVRNWHEYRFQLLSREEVISGPLREYPHEARDPEAVRMEQLDAVAGDRRKQEIIAAWSKTVPESPYFSDAERAELLGVLSSATQQLLEVK